MYLDDLLAQLLRQSGQLLGSTAGSISLIDPDRDCYAKMAEYGASCQLGKSFPLAEGVTGQVVARRRPVTLAKYSDIATGHLPVTHRATSGAVAAVPIWWRGDVIGANVVFAGGHRRFSAEEVDGLEMLTQLAVAGIMRVDRRPGAASSVWTAIVSADVVDRGRPPRLTPREHEVLQLMSSGMSDREVARALVISPKTAEKHVGAVLHKTGTTRRTAAVMRALEWGWLSAGGRGGGVGVARSPEMGDSPHAGTGVDALH